MSTISPISYEMLPCPEEAKQNIKTIVRTLGTCEKGWLNGGSFIFNNATRLYQLGNQVEKANVHPYKFLATIFTDEELRCSMQKVFGTYTYVGNQFVKDFSEKMQAYPDKNSFLEYLEPFAREVHRPVSTIKPYITSQNWRDLLAYLTNSEPLTSEKMHNL